MPKPKGFGVLADAPAAQRYRSAKQSKRKKSGTDIYRRQTT